MTPTEFAEFRNDFPNSVKNKVVLVMRGDCDYVTKVTNAEKAGVKALVISQDSTAVPLNPSSGSDKSFKSSIISGMVSRNTRDQLATKTSVKFGPKNLM